MLNTLFKKQEETSASANVVDGKLILSLPEAENPVVWQMDLSSAKASALEVKKDEEKDTYNTVVPEMELLFLKLQQPGEAAKMLMLE